MSRRLILLLLSALPVSAVPLTITLPSGTEIQLSSFKGKVVALEFFFVRSPHCLQLVEMLNKLNHDLGPQGFQPLAVAFGPGADPGVLTRLVDYFKLTYPVGFTAADRVDVYLGRQGMETLKIPQMVIIDRAGTIRATSGRAGDPAIETESPLRALLQALLRETR